MLALLVAERSSYAQQASDLVQGTLDMLILKRLALERQVAHSGTFPQPQNENALSTTTLADGTGCADLDTLAPSRHDTEESHHTRS
jgi:hypothetical protein